MKLEKDNPKGDRNSRTTHPKQAARRIRAAERRAESDERTVEEQLRRLIERGHGHCAEAERLRFQLS